MKQIIKYIEQLPSDIFNLFFPKVCLTCDALLLPNEQLVCHRCQSDFPFTFFKLDSDNPIYDRLSAIVNIQAASSLLLFSKSEIVKELIHQLKYKNRQEIGTFLADVYANQIKNNAIISQIDYVVPAPLHPKKQKKRGYNQLTTFSKTLAEKLDLQYSDQILIKTVNNTSQTTKTAAQRRENVAGVYRVKQPEKYNAKHILIVDDVMTTGATIEACAETILKQIPNAKVSVLTMAVVL